MPRLHSHALMLALVLAPAALGQGARSAPPASARPAAGVEDRAYWVSVSEKLARPVLSAAAAGQLHARMPLEITPANRGTHREAFAHLEAVGRLLVGIAPWLELDAADLPPAEQRWQTECRQLAVRTIAAICDPASPDYCNFSDDKQPLVDAAFLAQALLRAPRHLWQPLSERSKHDVLAALALTRGVKPRVGNWLMFTATVEAAMARFGGDGAWQRGPVDFALRAQESYYKGDGAYGDGPDFHWDYYNAFVIQPMLVDVLDVLGDRGPWVDAGFAKRVLVRAQRFAAVEERLISPEGAFPPIGRSLAYRVGALQGLAQIALRHALPHGVLPAQVRGALTAAIHRSLDAPGTFDDAGWLRIGFCGSQPSVGEGYISTGSSYLCSAVLLPLGLPPQDPFWQSPPADWTARKIYSGQPVNTDHALEEPHPPRPGFAPDSR